MKTERANIKGVERKIEEEAKRMATHTNERRERARAKLEDAKGAIEAAEARRKSFEVQAQEKQEELDDIQSEADRFQASLNQARSRVQECETQIKVARDSEKNALAPYGSGIEAVIKEVQTMRWHGQQPLGPLGRFVKLKDHQWADVLRVNLSGTMVSWAITDARDRTPLKALLERYGKYVARHRSPMVEAYPWSIQPESPHHHLRRRPIRLFYGGATSAVSHSLARS